VSQGFEARRFGKNSKREGEVLWIVRGFEVGCSELWDGNSFGKRMC